MYLQIGLCYISEQIEVLKVPLLNVPNVSQKSTRTEGKNVLGVVPLNHTYKCVTFSNDVNRISVETVGRTKRAFLCLYTYRKCDRD